jgi:hypothetical protein
MARAWAAITAQVFSTTFESVPRVLPVDFYEGFVKFPLSATRVLTHSPEEDPR